MSETVHNILPEAWLVLTATAMYVAGSFVTARRLWSWAAVGALAVSILLMGTGRIESAVSGDALASSPDRLTVLSDPLAIGGKLWLLFFGLVFVGLSWHETTSRPAEYYASLLLVVAGTTLTFSANDLVLLFLGLELVSIPTYVLLYLVRSDSAGQEAATKYFFLSVLSSALLLFGLSYLYGLTGTTYLPDVAAALESSRQAPDVKGLSSVGLIALVLIFAGLGFKITAVPFHFYAPDVYQGSTNLMAGVLAFAPKAAGFVALIRASSYAMVGYEPAGAFLATILAIITMTGGNVLALLQDNLRRLLAYSSIAHAGYMLIGVAAGFWDRELQQLARQGVTSVPFGGNQALLFYLLAYGLMTVGAFGVLCYLSRHDRSVEYVDELAGLGYTHPAAALAMGVFLFSLTGIPPLAGFWAKLAVFSSAVSAGQQIDGWFLSVVVVGVINTAIAAYYYLRIIGVMFLRQPLGALSPSGGRPAGMAVLACALLSVAIGFSPRSIFRPARTAADAAQPRGFSLSAPLPMSAEGAPVPGSHGAEQSPRAVVVSSGVSARPRATGSPADRPAFPGH